MMTTIAENANSDLLNCELCKKNYKGFALSLENDDLRLDRFRKQRNKFGFDETELWSLDCTMVKLALPRLKLYKKFVTGYPFGLKNNKQWKKIIKKIIKGLTLYIDWDKNSKPEYQKPINKGLRLFFKYFQSLWM